MIKAWFVLTCFFISSGVFAAFEIPEITGYVLDTTGTLAPEEVSGISAELDNLYRQKNVQWVIWITNSLQGEVIEDVSVRAVEKWKLGKKKEDRGLLLVMALADRKIRFEVGYGLEGFLTDLRTRQIIDQILAPQLKQNRFSDGILATISQVSTFIDNPDAKDLPKAGRLKRKLLPNLVFLILMFFVFIARMFTGMGGYRSHAWGSSRLPGHSRSGGFWSDMGGGGGGFSGGGGGGFGGGGSSSSW